ncbi:peptidylprolyl isomerase [Bacillus sp. CGMCC 1.16541]|uniref:peptidylprolyl isomerase n=1 Tax=Bacillus sp. CGMCC 1.16541 TaxID=2185143 RepID=UPI000D73CCEA|nr:peptidylprolyl isomerase [Bacillus sp. CGMCC 1.16541]
MKRSRFIPFLILVLTCTLLLAACGTSGKEEKDETTTTSPKGENDKNPVVTMTMESGDEMKLELYPDIAPNTVANFVSLIEDGFYDGLIFHRVIPGFMIQGGDPEGRGTGGPGYAIKGEFSSNGFDNNLKHETGVLSMARSNDPNSAGSQFFIMVENAPSLDGEYAAFGKVIEGIETAQNIVQVERDAQDKPLEDQKISKVTVDTFGVDYPEPERVQ